MGVFFLSFLLCFLVSACEQLYSGSCGAALPGFNAVLAHLHGDADGDPPTMGCEGGNKVSFFILLLFYF